MSKVSFEEIEPGDTVTLLVFAGRGKEGPTYRPASGRAVLLGPGGWVVDLGGAHGRPALCDRGNFLEAAPPRRRRRPAARYGS